MRTARTLVRRAVAEDLAQIEAWPSYPPQYDCFNMTPRPTNLSDKPPWWRRIDHADRCHYSVVLPRTGDVIGVHAFVAIEWDRGTSPRSAAESGSASTSFRSLTLAAR